MTTPDEKFKYDVAFSFCFEDEPQATELNDLIQARIAELGAKPREETVLDHAARMNREAEFQKQRKQFLWSPDAVQQSDRSFYNMAAEFERLRDELAKMGGEHSIGVRRNQLEM